MGFHGIFGEIEGFIRVGLVIVQFAGADSAGRPIAPFGVAMGGGAGRVAHELGTAFVVGWARELAEGGGFDGCFRVSENRAEGGTFELLACGEVAEIDEGRVEVDEFDRR